MISGQGKINYSCECGRRIAIEPGAQNEPIICFKCHRIMKRDSSTPYIVQKRELPETHKHKFSTGGMPK
jgi:hypothetical protein